MSSATRDHGLIFTTTGAPANSFGANGDTAFDPATGVQYVKDAVNGWVVDNQYTVSTLPAASAALKGARAFVTDATSPTFLGALTGGGAVVCPVFCNGSAWVAG